MHCSFHSRHSDVARRILLDTTVSQCQDCGDSGVAWTERRRRYRCCVSMLKIEEFQGQRYGLSEVPTAALVFYNSGHNSNVRPYLYCSPLICSFRRRIVSDFVTRIVH